MSLSTPSASGSNPNSNSTPSSSKSLSHPHAHFSATSQSRFSYATTSPPTPDADRLFFRPPPASPDPDITSSTSTPERFNSNGTSSMTNLVFNNSNNGEGVAVGYGMDPKKLADMLSPPEPSSSSSSTTSKKKKGKEKEKKLKGKSSNNSIRDIPSTPPPVPPKNLLPSTTPKSTRTTTSFSSSLSLDDTSHSHSYSRHSHSTEIHSPKKAIHGRMTSASSHQLNPKPSLVSLSGFSPTLPDYQPNYQVYYHQGQASIQSPNRYHEEEYDENQPRPSMNYPNPSESFEHETTLGHSRERLQASLAALPWAEPPPRQASPIKLSSPISASAYSGIETGTGYSSSTIRGGTGTETPQRTPTYSFLAKDPSASTPTNLKHSRRPSLTSSIKSQLTMPPIPEGTGGLVIPQSPSVWSQNQSRDSYRSSQQSGYSGMAEFQPSGSGSGSGGRSSPISQDISSPGIVSLISNGSTNNSFSPGITNTTASGSGSGGHDRYPSITSAMATKASSSASHSHSNGKWSLVSRSKSSSTTTSSKRSKSFKSIRSTKSSNRGSMSAHGHGNGRFVLRRWEVQNTHGQRWEVLDREEVKRKENQMDLRTLVGRAWVLERVLRSGKRVSSQSLKILRPFTPSSANSTPRPSLPHPPSSSVSKNKHRPSLSVTINPSRRSSLRHSFTHNTKHSPRSKSTSSTTTGTTSKKSRRGSAPSIRMRLGRKLRRTESREDIFTELGSEGSGSRGHSRDNSVSTHQGDDGFGEAYVSVSSPKRRSYPSQEKEKERGEERIGGKGVVVFPEEISSSSQDNIHHSPPLPPKDRKTTSYAGGNSCTTPNCFNLSPSSPTPLLPHPDLTTFQRTPTHGQYTYDQAQGQAEAGYDPEKGEVVLRYSPQSPHLGHRSPNWRNRQSVISYIETGVWEKKPKNRFKVWMGVGAGVVVLLIVGLLVGLLVRRKGNGG
ncbi:hypothetical protein I302_100038 [Kwoniella bestiolae CBS 10118]|uniref:Uncharacterized protein n=1 Tax=Kwoniella bestiolae CBS 10118 TaxID=1296100 RepID=A0A1B9G3V0_9TREE|nr:hypothetical protein I302_03410 [Kwoniella bestiolae CBS 10118]OCF25737.1 hypothetical protein I302_03410 [Kwoniella bestiolae CBS 10118]